MIGRLVSQALLGWLPGIGNAINASKAFTLTETIGWTIANNFAAGKREAEKAEAERIEPKEETAREPERIKCFARARLAELRHKEEERLKTVTVPVSRESGGAHVSGY